MKIEDVSKAQILKQDIRNTQEQIEGVENERTINISVLFQDTGSNTFSRATIEKNHATAIAIEALTKDYLNKELKQLNKELKAL